ncbi:MAG: glycosyltransferase family 2 protein [Rhodospirillaceae bacterium]|nr:glycosyltransferase family 2 protein [Rhodospirillaceae bacterium]
MTIPTVSVLTPTFNRAHVLHRAYLSLQRQKMRNFEWVVVDDGSSDDTPALLARWQAEADFPIVWCRYSNNRGKAAAVNTGSKVVSGDYVLVLDSDDSLLDHAMEMVIYWCERTKIGSNPSIYRLLFRSIYQSGNLVGNLGKKALDRFDNAMAIIPRDEAVYKLRMTFEFFEVLSREKFQTRKFVELTNSEYCPESVTHDKLSKRYDSIYINHPIRLYSTDDGECRISDGMVNAVYFPRGNYLRSLAILNGDSGFLWQHPSRLLNAARKVTRLGLHLGRSPQLQYRDLTGRGALLLWVSCMAVGILGYCRDRLRGKTAPIADRDISKWGPASPPDNLEIHLAPAHFGWQPTGQRPCNPELF